MTACTAGNSTEMALICLYVGLPKDVLHEYFALEVPSAACIFAQNEARCDEKNGNFTSEPCDKADDAKNSFPKRAINKKYTFFPMDFANIRLQ